MSQLDTKIKQKVAKHKPRLAFLALAGIIFVHAHPVVYASDLNANKILSLTNESRQAAGLDNLTLNSTLSAAAQAKAKDMIKNDYFAHTSPKGLSPWHWMSQSGYNYRYAGENLAINYESAKSEHSAWMKSPTHRANIMSAQYTEVGIAIAEGKIDGETTLVTVVMFGQPKVGAVPAKNQEPAITPQAVKGVSEVSEPLPAVVPSPAADMVTTQEPSAPVVAPKGINREGYGVLWMTIFGSILGASLLYSLYKQAIEHVVFEKGLQLALSGGGNLKTDDLLWEHQPDEPVTNKLE